MSRLVRLITSLRWTILSAALFVVLAALLFDDDNPLLRAYDGAFPVLRMEGVIVAKDSTQVIIQMYGEKFRPCKYIRIAAYGKALDGTLTNMLMERTDTPVTGQTRPTGKLNIGTWRLWPVDGITGAVVYIEHDCAHRPVLTKIADVSW